MICPFQLNILQAVMELFPVVRESIVSIMVSDIDPQGEYPYTVNISVTYPLLQSVVPGKYLVVFWFGHTKYPSPNVVHVVAESFVAVPLTIYDVSQHMVASIPASTVGE